MASELLVANSQDRPSIAEALPPSPQPANQSTVRLNARLRTDLIQSYHQNGDASYLVVKDPVRNRFFRFGEIEAFILGRLGPESTAEQLQAAVQEQFGAPLPRETLDQFVSKLSRIGLLQTEEIATPPTPAQKRVRGSLLYLRFPGFNPDRLVTWLARKVHFCFTPPFVIFATLAILWGIGFTVSNWGEITRDFTRLYSFSSFLAMYVTTLVVIAFHEFAHGVTCKHFGGSVREMGFILIYFQPAFYCNVSDAWLFPKKSHRLWVSFAGAYFEMLLWAFATALWCITDPHTVINYIALIIMATSAIKSIFNLNPLIKLDGYYLLSDWLGLPNLRQRAVGYLGHLFRKLLWIDSTGGTAENARERRIFIIYGILAWTYSTWLLAFIAQKFFGFATERYQGWGFLVFTFLLAQVFRQPLKRAFARPASTKASMKKWGKRTIRFGVLGGAIAALFLIRTELRISGPFYILPVHNCDVRAEVDGIIQRIFVDEGQTLKKGDLIAELADRDLRAELTKTSAQIDETQAKLKLLQAGTRAEELELARTLLKKAQERVDYASAQLNRDDALFKDRLISEREFELTKELAAVRKKESEEARDHLKLLQAGSRPEEIDAVAAELNRLKAHSDYIQQQIALLRIHSPVDGIVTTPRLRDKVGQALKKGDLIADVHEMRKV
ncbi:MAG TPA: biotin/lipoyl-binding protein, partial [Candidatus Binatia bacterium]|nr:biotin/lipoyl-binding protein [Candidatus Binatia bacterium]